MHRIGWWAKYGDRTQQQIQNKPHRIHDNIEHNE